MSERPGDDFNRRGNVRAVLEQFGWVRTKGGENEYWRRPDKTSGTSATLKDWVFYVFSSNAAPFEPNQAYSPFAVYTLLTCGGDYERAARELRHLGFGSDGSTDNATDVDISALIGQPAVDVAKPVERRLHLIRADKLERRAPSWLLRGILERDTLAMCFGDPGSGKTFLALDWAARIATGTPWRGHDVEAAPVIYVAGEGRNGLARRLDAWQRHHGVSLADAPLFVSSHPVGMIDPRQLAQLIEAVIEQADDPGMIVLDTLARNFGAGDENSTQDMSAFVAACDALRGRWRCCVMIVHHSGHADKSRARGAMALNAALDAEYRVRRDGTRLILSTTKMKDAEAPPPLAMELVTVNLPDVLDDDGVASSSAAGRSVCRR